ncbi:serine/threonine protein kinase, AGC [Marasmius tenuissimus]|uniref:Serine/threonine protein kinase, AGC n=1 Tax=Marasmius tenuissimus TaxID=585030 RepID=A0ABR3A798_9AGAR
MTNRLCFSEHGEGKTKLLVSTTAQRTGRTSIDTVAERWAFRRWSFDYQKMYYKELHKALEEAIGQPPPLHGVGAGTGPSRTSSASIETAGDLRRILLSDTGIDKVLALEELAVPTTVDLLHTEIRATAMKPSLSEYRVRCRKCLKALVNTHHILPASLFVNEVGKDGTHPLAGGGFSDLEERAKDIWKGTYGEESVCLKVLRIHIQGDRRKRAKVAEAFYKETLLWTQLSHPNLLPFTGVNTTLFPHGFCLVSPWMANGDIVTFLALHPDHEKLTVILEIAGGMAYLHGLKIVHGDIKGANVLVDEQGRCRLADFGLAVIAAESTELNNSSASSAKGSLRWMAPEVFNVCGGAVISNNGERGKRRTIKLARDIYAFACTVLEIITGKPPFPDLIDAMVMFQVAVHDSRPPRPTNVIWCPSNIWALMQQCWTRQAQDRPEASEIHDFLSLLENLRRAGSPWEHVSPDILLS